MSLTPIHIHWDTPKGRLPFTLFVFGPYAAFGGAEYDVEIYSGHIVDAERRGSIYIGTVSDLARDTHIITDIWNDMDRMVNSNDFIYANEDRYGDLYD